MNWGKTSIKLDSGVSVEGISPIIISASRSTDIPAFYSEWLINRIKRGYIAWVNPFNQAKQYISFKKARLLVFWSKNPEPLIPYLEILNRYGLNYYFHITLNDYVDENLEPNVPPLQKRINMFKRLSESIGKEKVIWRFDPLILSNKINLNLLLSRIQRIGDELNTFTEKLVISFADINIYRKVNINLTKLQNNYREFSKYEIIEFAKGLSNLNKSWNLSLATCCEESVLQQYGIQQNRCIDDELIVKLFSKDTELMSWLGYSPNLFNNNPYVFNQKYKDKGQRKACGCIYSKDIGMYNTCNHLCHYCYANYSTSLVAKNISMHNKQNESII